MSYQLRVVIEKVSNKTDKVVKRETIETFDIEKPKNIFDLGLRHKDQIALLKIIQDHILNEQSVFLSEDITHCPQCGRKLAKQGHKKSDFHAVFTDHKIAVQRLTCFNPKCNWRSVPSVKSLFGTSMHPDLVRLQCETSALHSFREGQEILTKLSVNYRKINNHDRLKQVSEIIGNYLSKLNSNVMHESLLPAPADELIVQVDGGHIKNKSDESRSFEALSAVIFKPENLVQNEKEGRKIIAKHCVASAKNDKQKSMQKYLLSAAKKEGLSKKTKLTVLCDGAKNCWSSTVLLKNQCEKFTGILDWFHIGMKFQNVFNILPKEHQETLEHIKWRVWNGDAQIAQDRLLQLKETLQDESQKNRVDSLHQYLKNNKEYLVNYAIRKNLGLIFTSSIAESNVESLINNRFKKLNKMQWTRDGAHQILQIRSAMISKDWSSIWENVVVNAFQMAV